MFEDGTCIHSSVSLSPSGNSGNATMLTGLRGTAVRQAANDRGLCSRPAELTGRQQYSCSQALHPGTHEEWRVLESVAAEPSQSSLKISPVKQAVGPAIVTLLGISTSHFSMLALECQLCSRFYASGYPERQQVMVQVAKLGSWFPASAQPVPRHCKAFDM